MSEGVRLGFLCSLLFLPSHQESVPPIRRPLKQEAVLKATAVRSPLPVMSLILPCPPCLPNSGGVVQAGEGGLVRGGGLAEGGGWGRGTAVGGGWGTFYPPCHVLHYHLVLRPKGSSHNKPDTSSTRGFPSHPTTQCTSRSTWSGPETTMHRSYGDTENASASETGVGSL